MIVLALRDALIDTRNVHLVKVKFCDQCSYSTSEGSTLGCTVRGFTKDGRCLLTVRFCNKSVINLAWHTQQYHKDQDVSAFWGRTGEMCYPIYNVRGQCACWDASWRGRRTCPGSMLISSSTTRGTIVPPHISLSSSILLLFCFLPYLLLYLLSYFLNKFPWLNFFVQ